MRRLRRLTFRDTVVCSIGSTDPTGHAGLFLDAAVYAGMPGVRPAFVVAGVTAQTDKAVLGVYGLPADAIVRQLEAVWRQSKPDAVRIGLLPGARSCDAVVTFLERLRPRPPIVVDPVLAASSGGRLAQAGAEVALRRLVRVATIVTPNAREAARLARVPPLATINQCAAAARALRAYCAAVLVTGGDLRTGASVTDVFAHDDSVTLLASPRIDVDMRGTGCRLACAIAVALARGEPLRDAVDSGRRFVRASLRRAAAPSARHRHTAGVHRRTV